MPTIKVKKEKFKSGINIIDIVFASNLLNSKSEVRRMINNKGIKINNITVENEQLKIFLDTFNNENNLKLSVGKKKHAIIKLI